MTTKEREVLTVLLGGTVLYKVKGATDTWESKTKQFTTRGTVLKNLDRKGWVVIFRAYDTVAITGEGEDALLAEIRSPTR